jgi:uncharacterized protein (DUF983 family)
MSVEDKCPRCDGETLVAGFYFGEESCANCSLRRYNSLCTSFSTDKYRVFVYVNITNVFVNAAAIEQSIHKRKITIPKAISIKATEEDIEKLLLLV